MADIGYAVTFREITEQSLPVSRVGGKAWHLAELDMLLARARSGQGASLSFVVPAGVVLTTEAFEQHLAEAGLNAEAIVGAPHRPGGLEAVRAQLLRTPVSPLLSVALFEACERAGLAIHSGEPFAVRSSGTMEDTSAKSFAGQYETKLNVRGWERIERAILECWASQYHDHVNAYLGEIADASLLPKMAVVVQRQIVPGVAGVMFTIDPATAASEIVIEAVYGLGEGLVSGQLTPDRVRVDPVTYETLETRAVAQRRKYVCLAEAGADLGAEQIAVVPTSDAEAASSPLASANLVATLAQTGAELARLTGHPQDIEWCLDASSAQLCLVQMRPVTAFTFPRSAGLWAMVLAYRTSQLSESMNVLGFEKCIRSLHEAIGRPPTAQPDPPEGNVWHKMFFGRGYAAAWASRLYNRHASEEPFSSEEFAALLDWWGDERRTMYEASYASVVDPIIDRILASSPYAGARWPVRQDDAPLAKLRDAELGTMVCDLMSLMIESDAASWASGFLARLLETYCEYELDTINETLPASVKPFHISRLITGVSKNHHTTGRQPMQELAEIAKRYAASAELGRLASAAMHDKNYVAMLTSLQASADTGALSPECSAFMYEFQTYLAKWCWMAEEDWDLAAPHWGDNPELPTRVFCELLLAAADRLQRAPAESAAAAAAAADAVPETPISAAKAAGTAAIAMYQAEKARLREHADKDAYVWDLLGYLRDFLALKERVHVLYVRCGFLTKIAALELGRRWQRLGLIAKAEDILETRTSTVRMWSEGSLSFERVRLAAARNRHEGLSWKNFDAPYWAGRKYERVQRQEVAIDPATRAAHTHRGLPCSQGRDGAVTGPARVIRTLAESGRVKKGDVLVTATTSPSWTPLFAYIGAVVLSEGGQLSHGAVVAREFGIPCVTGIDNVTELFADGELVCVDGEEGVVIRLGA